MTEEKLERAKRVFSSLCSAFDERGWHYKKYEEQLKVESAFQGDALPMNITLFIDVEEQIVILFSPLPFAIPEDKRVEAAIAISVVNNGMIDGSFDYNIADGHIFFRMSNSFLESEIGNELFEYMLSVSSKTIDEYNDRFLMLGKGLISIEDFISK